MYEKPQYLTPSGYKRLDKNPYSNPLLLKKILQEKKLTQQNEKNVNSKRILSAQNRLGSQKRVQISDQAAKLIALAIRDLLNT